MRVYLAAICLFSSMVAQADLFGELKALGESLQKQIPTTTQNPNNTTTPISDDPVTGPSGIVASCSEINAFRYGDNKSFNISQKDWTPEMVSFLKNTVDRCSQQTISLQTPNNYDDKVMQINRRAEEKKAELDAAYANELQKKQQQAVINSQQTQQSEIEQKYQQFTDCQNGDEFLLYQAQEVIIIHQQNINRFKGAQANDRKITQESGVRDLNNERQLGAAIVGERNELDHYFTRYKKLGGVAKSPQMVTHLLKSPCEQYRTNF